MSVFNEGLLYHLVNKYHIVGEEWQYLALLFVFVIISVAAAYLLGSVNSAIIVSRIFYGEDVRTKGSGNAGLTNMLRNYGKRGALMTLLGDVSKTVIAILFTAFLLGFNYNNAISLNAGYCYLSGLFVALGHVFPIYYKFKGGKGVLVTAVTAMILTPIPALVLLLLFVAIVSASRYVSLGSVSVAALYPGAVCAYVSLMCEGQKLEGLLVICLILLAVLIVWCHRENIKRLLAGTENKISFKKRKDDDCKS